MAGRAFIRREIPDASGWSMEWTTQGVSISGGTHAGAYAPVVLSPGNIEAFIADLAHMGIVINAGPREP